MPTHSRSSERTCSQDADNLGVYLASRFARRDEMRQIASELESHGYEVTSRWLDSPGSLGQGELDGTGRAAALAAMDLKTCSERTSASPSLSRPTSRSPDAADATLSWASPLGSAYESCSSALGSMSSIVFPASSSIRAGKTRAPLSCRLANPSRLSSGRRAALRRARLARWPRAAA